MPQDPGPSIPKTLRILCAYQDITVSALGARIGLSPAVMSNRMAGKPQFSYDELVAISDVLDVKPSVWFDKPQNALSHLRIGRDAVDVPPSVHVVTSGDELVGCVSDAA